MEPEQVVTKLRRALDNRINQLKEFKSKLL